MVFYIISENVLCLLSGHRWGHTSQGWAGVIRTLRPHPEPLGPLCVPQGRQYV